jgi:hypothetical protein
LRKGSKFRRKTRHFFQNATYQLKTGPQSAVRVGWRRQRTGWGSRSGLLDLTLGEFSQSRTATAASLL